MGASQNEEATEPTTPKTTVAAPSPVPSPAPVPAKKVKDTASEQKAVDLQFSCSAETLVLGSLNSQSSFEDTQPAQSQSAQPDPVQAFLENFVDKQSREERLRKAVRAKIKQAQAEEAAAAAAAAASTAKVADDTTGQTALLAAMERKLAIHA